MDNRTSETVRVVAKAAIAGTLLLAAGTMLDGHLREVPLAGLALAAGLKTTASAEASATADASGSGTCRSEATSSATAVAGDQVKHDEAYQVAEESADGCSARASARSSATSESEKTE